MIDFSQVEEQFTQAVMTLVDFMISVGILLVHIWLWGFCLIVAATVVCGIYRFLKVTYWYSLSEFQRYRLRNIVYESPVFRSFKPNPRRREMTHASIALMTCNHEYQTVLSPPPTGLRIRMLPDRELPAEPADMVARLRSTRDTLQPVGTAEEQARRREILDDRINKVVLAASLSAGELQDRIVDDLAAEADDLLGVLRDQYGLDDDAFYRYGMG